MVENDIEMRKMLEKFQLTKYSDKTKKMCYNNN